MKADIRRMDPINSRSGSIKQSSFHKPRFQYFKTSILNYTIKILTLTIDNFVCKEYKEFIRFQSSLEENK